MLYLMMSKNMTFLNLARKVLKICPSVFFWTPGIGFPVQSQPFTFRFVFVNFDFVLRRLECEKKKWISFFSSFRFVNVPPILTLSIQFHRISIKFAPPKNLLQYCKDWFCLCATKFKQCSFKFVHWHGQESLKGKTYTTLPPIEYQSVTS